jgi:tetratricopeptide (TPR) repeat protein
MPAPHIAEQMMQGIFGRRKDPAFEAQEYAYDAMDAMAAGDVERALEMAVRAYKLDPNCVDAMHILAEMSSETKGDLIEKLGLIVSRAERAMGKKFLKENAGYFWGLLETRPYMRVRGELARAVYEMGRIEEAIEHFEGMLHLNPNDNQGNRYSLIGCYLETGNAAGAHRIFKEYPDEGSAMFAWARVLTEVLADDEPAAKSALKEARQVNKHVEAYLTGRKKMPKEGPPYYSPGEPSEAVVCMYEIGGAWKKHPAAIEWLKKQAPRATGTK